MADDPQPPALGARLTLPPLFDGVAATDLHAALLRLIAGSGRVIIDGAAVERASTHGVQVLLAAAKTLAAQGSVLALLQPSPALCAAFADLGLGDAMTNWEQAGRSAQVG